jgi:hypothetical protein
MPNPFEIEKVVQVVAHAVEDGSDASKAFLADTHPTFQYISLGGKLPTEVVDKLTANGSDFKTVNVAEIVDDPARVAGEAREQALYQVWFMNGLAAEGRTARNLSPTATARTEEAVDIPASDVRGLRTDLFRGYGRPQA